MSEWQPIETAPINVPVLVAFEVFEYDFNEDPPRRKMLWHVWPAMKNLFYRKRKPVWLDLHDERLDYHNCMRFWMPFPSPPEAK
jgi:hypothetical protein